MTFAIRTTTLAIHLPPGTTVAKPPRARMCWSAVLVSGKTPLAQPRQCAARARGSKLTCHSHRRWEDAARELQNVLAAQEYGGAGDWAGDAK